MILKYVILLLSGGLDSVMLLYDLCLQRVHLHCLMFDYGQHHIKELQFAKAHCQNLGVLYTEIELHRIRGLFKRSALTDGKGSVIVPNRNAVFLHISAGIAASEGVETVCYACNADDQKDFPDCRPEFIAAMNSTLKAAEIKVEITAPYIDMTKKQIVERARKHNWPYHDTLSCYEGTECGKCDACKKRITAILEA